MQLTLRLRTSAAARALALLGLLLTAGEGALAHHGETLHELRLVPRVELSSGCAGGHPPSFEPVLSRHLTSCLGCLSQAQQRSACDGFATLPVPVVIAGEAVGSAPTGFRHLARRAPSSRGPPAA